MCALSNCAANRSPANGFRRHLRYLGGGAAAANVAAVASSLGKDLERLPRNVSVSLIFAGEGYVEGCTFPAPPNGCRCLVLQRLLPYPHI
jgi:hypothetical protein